MVQFSCLPENVRRILSCIIKYFCSIGGPGADKKLTVISEEMEIAEGWMDQVSAFAQAQDHFLYVSSWNGEKGKTYLKLWENPVQIVLITCYCYE